MHWCADLLGDLTVGSRLPVGNGEQRFPHLSLEFGPDHAQRQVEFLQFAGEVRVELFDGIGERGDRRAASRRGSGS